MHNPDYDLFGEPIAQGAKRKGGKERLSAKAVEPHLEERPNGETGRPRTTLLLPERFRIHGYVLGSEIRQLECRERRAEGALTAVQFRGLSAHRFAEDDGLSVLVVSRKTLIAVSGEPVLLVPGATDERSIVEGLERREGAWLSPKPLRVHADEGGDFTTDCREVLDSWAGGFAFREGSLPTADTAGTPGLRRPQVGALHAALAHATTSTAPATIVMPTGTGKTETMLAIYAHQRTSCLIVVVPTDPLRDQIARKFETMGVLQEQKCLTMDAKYPIVVRLQHIPKSAKEVDLILSRANVVVTTMAIAGRASAEVQESIAQRCGALYIDEAHHIKANTWRAFRAWFEQAAEGKEIYQFTATPFREDGGKVDGKFIYYYPLAKAQAEGYFGKIRFVAVSELETDETDEQIITEVGKALTADIGRGYNHLAMVRCKSIKRAESLHHKYSKRLSEFNPVLVHSNLSALERASNLVKLRRLESRIVVCVDMLGEGFDLPELKIAGIHDVFASVAVTMQFVGRFARSRQDLGPATVIANTDQDRVDRALAKLYAEEADWNLIVSTINADRIGKEMERAEVLEGFVGELTDIPLQTIEPTMSTLVFETPGSEAWDPHKIQDQIPHGSFVGMKLNERQRIAVCVLRHETLAKWTESSTATDVTWELLLAHWDEKSKILYLSSSGASANDTMARSICGDAVQRIKGQDVFRCFHEFRQLVIRNLGMTHRQGGGTRYSMLMGIDVSDGIDSLKKSERIQNNIFGSGFEDGEPTTLGCSIKGKFWSQTKVHDFTDWIQWSHKLGALVTNSSIPASAAFESAMRPQQIHERPDAHPLVISWPMGLLAQFEERVEISFNGVAVPFGECEIVLASHDRTGPLRFTVRGAAFAADFEVAFKGNDALYPQVSGPGCSIRTRRGELAISEFFADDAPQIDFGDGSFLIYSHLYVPPEELDLTPILDGVIEPWDWSGTDIRVESQTHERKPESIQFRVIRELEKDDYDIIFDDDGTGEFADVIAIRIREDVVSVLMCHCKFASSDGGATNLNDIYVVAGQALKSVQFCHKPKRFLRNMVNREKRRRDRGEATRFERGTIAELRQLQSRWDQHRFEYGVWIVQPGISKAAASQPMLQLLGMVEKALLDHRRIPLRVITRA